jgi:hypothetical protein
MNIQLDCHQFQNDNSN